jgi:hypothetical protein
MREQKIATDSADRKEVSTMKKVLLVILIVVLAGGLLVMGNTRAEAMNKESAALLTGAIAVFGPPVLYATSRGVYRPGPAYAASYPVRTGVVYEHRSYAPHERRCGKQLAYERVRRDGVRHGYIRGPHDGRRY